MVAVKEAKRVTSTLLRGSDAATTAVGEVDVTTVLRSSIIPLLEDTIITARGKAKVKVIDIITIEGDIVAHRHQLIRRMVEREAMTVDELVAGSTTIAATTTTTAKNITIIIRAATAIANATMTATVTTSAMTEIGMSTRSCRNTIDVTDEANHLKVAAMLLIRNQGMLRAASLPKTDAMRRWQQMTVKERTEIEAAGTKTEK